MLVTLSTKRIMRIPVSEGNVIAVLATLQALSLTDTKSVIELRLSRIAIRVSGCMLILTGVVKLLSAAGNSAIVKTLDPIFGVPFEKIFLFVGLVELIVGTVCLFGKNVTIQVFLLVWLSTCILIYRLSLYWIGWVKPCSCLGNLTGSLHISSKAADTIMKVILMYLLIGSYAMLFLLWRQGKRPAPAP